jgi:hypothetical protein
VGKKEEFELKLVAATRAMRELATTAGELEEAVDEAGGGRVQPAMTATFANVAAALEMIESASRRSERNRSEAESALVATVLEGARDSSGARGEEGGGTQQQPSQSF